MENRPHIGIGIDSFSKLINKGCLYVDKTDLIRDILESGKEVTLFTRPRRFGKSLAMSMLADFFDIAKKERNARLFDGLKISEHPEICREHQNAYPVISLSFKDVYGDTPESALKALRELIAELYQAAAPILLTGLQDEDQREHFVLIKSGKCDPDDLGHSLRFLTELLHRHYGLPAIVLLDEYDVPLQKAFIGGYYQQILTPIQRMMSAVFKGNHSLKFGVITGCLRIVKESIFTGMNNFSLNSVLTDGRPEYFGFTPAETEKLLTDCGLADEIAAVQKWYDGYQFGDNEIYNPWSVLNFAEQGMHKPETAAQPYWKNTSGNEIFLYLLNRLDRNSPIRSELEGLLEGKPVIKKITETTTFSSLSANTDSIWSLLLFTGYLKPAPDQPDGNMMDGKRGALILPNEEIKQILIDKIDEWFEAKKANYASSALAEAIFNGDSETAQREVIKFLQESVSVRDEKEDFYHGVLLALMRPKSDEYQLISNRESGGGYIDIALRNDIRKLGVVIEIKKGETPKYKPGERSDEYYLRQIKALNSALDQAEHQIRCRNYPQTLLQDGCRSCICYAAAFAGKECRIRKVEIQPKDER